MFFLPEWAPNLHPMLVHFPIVLLIIAVLFDLAALIFKKYNWLRFTADLLYILGGLAAIITYLSGKQAASSVHIPSAAYPTLSTHADWALKTVIFFAVYALSRLYLSQKKYTQRGVIPLLLFFVGLAGIYLLVETGGHGAELVFRYGVGVQAEENSGNQLEKMQPQIELLAKSGIIRQENGSWQWKPQ
jgi:uncharacterized membrane protein